MPSMCTGVEAPHVTATLTGPEASEPAAEAIRDPSASRAYEGVENDSADHRAPCFGKKGRRAVSEGHPQTPGDPDLSGSAHPILHQRTLGFKRGRSPLCGVWDAPNILGRVGGKKESTPNGGMPANAAPDARARCRVLRGAMRRTAATGSRRSAARARRTPPEGRCPSAVRGFRR